MRIHYPILAMLFSGALHAQHLNITFFDATCGDNTGWAIVGVDTIGFPLPHTYDWEPEPGDGQGTNTATGLAPGTYTLTVMDADGNAEIETFTIDALPGLLIPDQVIETAWSCFQPCAGSTSIWGTAGWGGVGPYTGGSDPPVDVVNVSNNGFSASGMCAGDSHVIIITDQNGCSSTFTIAEVVEFPALEVLALEITPSCPEGSTGTVHVEFNRPVQIFSPPFQTGGSANEHSFAGIPAGEHNVQVHGLHPVCTDTFYLDIQVPAAMDGCGTISGVLFADLNEDCDQDPGEIGIPYRTLTLSPDPTDLVITDANGNFLRHRLFGAHELNVEVPGFTPLCPDLPYQFELTVPEPEVEVYLAMEHLSGGPDAFVHMNASQPRIGDSAIVWITVHNDGPYVIAQPVIQLNYSDLLDFGSSPIPPSSITTTQLEWMLPELAPFSQWQVSARFDVLLDVDLIGEEVSYDLQLIQQVPDIDPGNDHYGMDMEIVSAYDPNDKLATPRSSYNTVLFLEQYYILNYQDHIDFIVRFQNTGNAAVEHVYIIDTIASYYRPATLQILGASHLFEVQWLDGSVLRFDFPDIMLPDSATDLLGSQGYVGFRFLPNNDELAVLDTLTNTADIYFDLNPPIRTNTTMLIADYWLSAGGIHRPSIHLAPNPADRSIRISGVDMRGGSWQVTGVDGRVLLTGRIHTEEALIDVTQLKPGQYVMVVDKDETSYRAMFIKE